MNDASSTWFAEVRASGVTAADVAAALGMAVRRTRLPCCPACNAEDTEHGCVTTRGPLWRCHRCAQGGDAIKLAAWIIVHTDHPTPHEWGKVRAEFAARGWCSSDGRRSTFVPPPPRPVEVVPYPDEPGLQLLLGSGGPVEQDPEVWSFWQRRRFGPHTGALWALPATLRGAEWPGWWGCGWKGLWRLACPAYDRDGVVRSLHARAIADTDKGKTRWPKERSAERLVFADPWLGVPCLRGEPVDYALVVEGITDYAAATSRRHPRVAVFGAASGGFQGLDGLRARVIFVGTDDDPAGDAYAEIVRVGNPAAEVRRIRWGDVATDPEMRTRRERTGKGPDADDVLGSGVTIAEAVRGSVPYVCTSTREPGG